VIHLISFTDRGQALAETLARELDGRAVRCGPGSLDGWTREKFQPGNALVFVGAVGIAVRAIAPCVKSKTADSAVVAVDEGGQFAIPILSGHLGGANGLAEKIAAVCGAVPVITTATDLRGLFAVDQWAKQQNCAILNPGGIKRVSGSLLAGERVELCSPWPVVGEPPEGVSLRLMPKIAVLGVGCKKGTPVQALEEAFTALPVHPASFRKVCTIDWKQNEPGLLAFCHAHSLELEVFSAAQLRAVPGNFSGSEFVEQVTGVDNVCERAAVLGSGGALCLKKRSRGGVTMAVAAAAFAPDWRWRDE
jgi:cobalt-precorrin 5A hydrolase